MDVSTRDPGTPVADELVVTETPLGGRASRMNNRRDTHLFGAISSDPGNPITTFLDPNNIIGSAGIEERVPDRSVYEQLWRIRSAGVEVIRTGNNLTPLNRRALVGTSRGLGGVNGYKLLVQLGSSDGESTFRMDIGETIDIVATSINISFVAPVNAIEVGSVDQAGTRTGMISDALVGYSVHMIEAADEHTEFTYTQYLLIPSNTVSVVQIPRFARSVKVQMGLDVVAAAWTKSTDTLGLLPIGPLEFNAAGTVSTNESESVGSGGFLRTDSRAPVRFATLIWTIRP